MSDKHDENYQVIEDGAYEDNRDRWIQMIIKKFDDPDYEGLPLILDEEGLWVPDGTNLVQLVKGLQLVIKGLKQKIFNEQE